MPLLCLKRLRRLLVAAKLIDVSLFVVLDASKHRGQVRTSFSILSAEDTRARLFIPVWTTKSGFSGEIRDLIKRCFPRSALRNTEPLSSLPLVTRSCAWLDSPPWPFEWNAPVKRVGEAKRAGRANKEVRWAKEAGWWVENGILAVVCTFRSMFPMGAVSPKTDILAKLGCGIWSIYPDLNQGWELLIVPSSKSSGRHPHSMVRTMRTRWNRPTRALCRLRGAGLPGDRQTHLS